MFTGRLVGEILHGPGKAHAVRSLAIREGLNLKRCTAYSDSFNDVPMLSLVGTAVAINPDARLRDLARERGWEIRDFRTARKAARIGVPSALALGAAGGALAALASRRTITLISCAAEHVFERAEQTAGMTRSPEESPGTHRQPLPAPDYFEVGREKIREFATRGARTTTRRTTARMPPPRPGTPR